MSNGVKIDGAPFSSNLYEKIGDKQRVWLDFFHYDSLEEVKKAFNVQVKMATKVVEKGNLLDSQDHIMGLIFSPRWPEFVPRDCMLAADSDDCFEQDVRNEDVSVMPYL